MNQSEVVEWKRGFSTDNHSICENQLTNTNDVHHHHYYTTYVHICVFKFEIKMKVRSYQRKLCGYFAYRINDIDVIEQYLYLLAEFWVRYGFCNSFGWVSITRNNKSSK